MVKILADKALAVIVMNTFLFSTACMTSTRVIKAQPDTIQNELKKGDRVKVTTKGGSSFRFRIADISSEAIIGRRLKKGKPVGPDNLQILFNEIAKIEQTDGDKGIDVAILVAIGIAVMFGVINFKF